MQTEEIRSCLWRFFRREGRLPSYSEICRLFGFASKNAASRLVDRLVEEGMIEKTEMGKLIPKQLSVPLRVLGTVAAGIPHDAEEQHFDTLSLDNFLVDDPFETFLLRVTGDSMIDEGIKPGDLVVIDRKRKAHHGDVVLAQIDGAWTLKYFEKNGNEVRLVAANTKYAPLYPKEELILGGVVNGVVRKYN
ncbi:transcriptional repressor LexA [bacterium]|nr:transcriptional repressor LexA [bacterium]